jgi:hypothetical protein
MYPTIQDGLFVHVASQPFNIVDVVKAFLREVQADFGFLTTRGEMVDEADGTISSGFE